MWFKSKKLGPTQINYHMQALVHSSFFCLLLRQIRQNSQVAVVLTNEKERERKNCIRTHTCSQVEQKQNDIQILRHIPCHAMLCHAYRQLFPLAHKHTSTTSSKFQLIHGMTEHVKCGKNRTKTVSAITDSVLHIGQLDRVRHTDIE